MLVRGQNTRPLSLKEVSGQGLYNSISNGEGQGH